MESSWACLALVQIAWRSCLALPLLLYYVLLAIYSAYLISTTRSILMYLQAPERDESSHSSTRTWQCCFSTSPRCNNGMYTYIHSERFALYYTLFSVNPNIKWLSVISWNTECGRMKRKLLYKYLHLFKKRVHVPHHIITSSPWLLIRTSKPIRGNHCDYRLCYNFERQLSRLPTGLVSGS